MDLTNLLLELRAESARINEAIAVVERLVSASGTRRRGRPPKWLQETRLAAQPNRPAAAPKERASKD